MQKRDGRTLIARNPFLKSQMSASQKESDFDDQLAGMMVGMAQNSNQEREFAWKEELSTSSPAMAHWPKTTKKNKRPARLRGLSLDMSPQTASPANSVLIARGSGIVKQSTSAKSNQFVNMISPLNHIDYQGEAIDEYDENMVEYDGRGFSSGEEEDEVKFNDRQSTSTTR